MAESKAADPIVIDLGKVKKKTIKALRNGHGPLVIEVESAVDQVRARLGTAADAKVMVPIVLFYEKKAKRRSRRGLRTPFCI